MTFGELAQYFEKLEKTPSRLAMTEILAELFKKVSSEEIVVVVNLSLGQLRPKFDRLEFNLAEKMVMRAMALAFGVPVDEVKEKYKGLGDIGAVVETQNSKLKAQSLKLSILGVFDKLVEIARDSGQGSQERKVASLAGLLKDLDAKGGKYVGRMVVGKLRLGFSDMTILDALSWMETGGKEKRKELENAYQLTPDVGELARLVKKVGCDKAQEKVEVKLGVPVIPALAQRLKTADEMIAKMEKVGVEPKYDGTRVQIHYRKTKNQKLKTKNYGAGGLFDGGGEKDWSVRTFTRNLDETTEMFPEVQSLGDWVDAQELILDSEAVGFDPKTGKMRPFQETIQRKRKHGVAQAAVEIPLKFFVFDVLYKDGKSLVKLPYHKRREILEKTIKKNGVVVVPEMLETKEPDKLREFHKRQLGGGLEGALVKKWEGIYEPGRRGWSWVKFKEAEDSKAKLSDTVDALVMGIYSGRGKRTSFGVGAFLIGIKGEGKITSTKLQASNKSQKSNDENSKQSFEEGKFYTISKVGTGLTDEQWRELKTRSEKLKIEDKPKEYVVDKNQEPDVWLTPGLVVEIAADEVTRSPIHTAGVALRFPRLVGFRDDKGKDEVTSVRELAQIG